MTNDDLNIDHQTWRPNGSTPLNRFRFSSVFGNAGEEPGIRQKNWRQKNREGKA